MTSKAVEKEVVFTALELALASATKRRFQEDIETHVSIDRLTGSHQSFRRWLVVEDGAVEDPARQISLSDALITDADIKVGDHIEVQTPGGGKSYEILQVAFV